MIIPKAIKLFPLAPVSWRTRQPESQDTFLFTVTPEKDVKKFLQFMGTKISLTIKGEERDDAKELLACGAPVGFRLGNLLAKGFPDIGVEHAVIKGDCSQQRWLCGRLAVRQVSCVEDLLGELKIGKPSLCVIEHDNIMVRSAMEEYHDFLEATPPANRTLFPKKVSTGALDLLPEAILLSPETRYIITSHQRGSGVPGGDRARYKQFPHVLGVVGRVDTSTNGNFLLRLICQHYAGLLPC